jgi:hypothetical protein
MTGFLKAMCGVLLFVVLFCLWWSVYSANGYDALAGTYVFHGNGERCLLYLGADRTFRQELRRGEEVKRSQGQWHRYGQAHVSFSDEFMRVAGEELNASGEAHGEFDKVFGLFPILVLAPLPGGPRFHRNLFH